MLSNWSSLVTMFAETSRKITDSLPVIKGVAPHTSNFIHDFTTVKEQALYAQTIVEDCSCLDDNCRSFFFAW